MICRHHSARCFQRHLVEQFILLCLLFFVKRRDDIFSTHFNRICLSERSSLDRNEHLKLSLMDVSKHGLVPWNMPSSLTIVPPEATEA